MKRVFLLSLFVSAGLWAQTAPSAYTTNYRIRQWASGANPSADSLNANWTLIDTKIRAPGYILPDSVIIGAATSPIPLDLYVADDAKIEDQLTVGAILAEDATTNNGSSATPWDTIYAVDIISPGGNLIVRHSDGSETFKAFGNEVYIGNASDYTGLVYLYNSTNAFYHLITSNESDPPTANTTFYLPNRPTDTLMVIGGRHSPTLTNLTITGNINIAGIAGEGTVDIPVIVDTVSRVAQSGSISATNLTGTTATGVYRVNIYLEADDIPGAADSVYATLQWEGNDGENITESTSAIVLTATTINTHKTFFINHTGAGSVSIQWSTTYASGAGGTDTYLISIVAERLN